MPPSLTGQLQADLGSGVAPRRRRRRRLVSGALAAIAVAIVAAAVAGHEGSPIVKGGGSAPEFVLENVHPGEPPVSLETLRGKPVVLNFWASWCGPCRKEMPAFEAVHQQAKDRIRFVGIDNQDYRDSALELLRQTGVSYPSGFDPKGKVAASFGLVGMPTTVFISGDGRLLERRTGEMNREQLEETIERLFAESEGNGF